MVSDFIMNTKPIAKVIVSLSLDRVFDYRIPEGYRHLIEIGSQVEIPFNHTVMTGFVLDLIDKSSYHKELKEINKVFTDKPSIPHKLIELGEWMASYYCCSKEQAIQCLLPAAVRSGKTKHKMRKMIHLNEDADIAAAIQAKETKSPKQAAVLKRMQILKTAALYSLKHHAS